MAKSNKEGDYMKGTTSSWCSESHHIVFDETIII